MMQDKIADAANASRTVVVYGAPPSATPLTVAAHFKPCGPVAKLTMLTTPQKKPLGVTYVEFKQPTSVPKALALSTTKLDGHTIHVAQRDSRATIA